MTEKEEKAFEEIEIKADLLLIVKFVTYKNVTINFDYYRKNDDDDNYDSKRPYMRLL